MAKVNTTAHESDIEMNQQNVLAVLLPAGVDYATVAAQGEMSKMQKKIDALGQPQTFADIAQTIDQSKIDSQRGQAAGVRENIAAGVDYAKNAMYGEESQQQSTKAKLDAQGGVEGAVKVDTTDAQIKAKTQQDVLDAQLKATGKDDAGLKGSADDLSKAADKLAQTAGTLAGGKSASDIEHIARAGGSEKYIEGQAEIGTREGGKLAKSIEVAGNQDAKDNILNTNYKGAKALGHGDEFIKEAEALGFGKFNPMTGKFTATDNARDWVAATGAASANNATMEDSWTIGGVAFSQKLDSHGNGTVTATAGNDEKILSTSAEVRNIEDSAQANHLKADEIKDQKEETASNVNIKDKLETGLAAKVITGRVGKDGIVSSEEDSGTKESSFLAEHIDEMAMGTGAAIVGTTGLTAVNKVSKMIQPEKIPMTEKDMQTRGFEINEDGTATNKNGTTVTHSDGKFYDAHGDLMKKDNPKYQTGVVKRGFDAAISKADDVKSSFTSPATRSDKPIDEAKQHKNDESHGSRSDSPDDKVQHDNPSNKDTGEKTSPSKDSIAKFDETAKPYDDVEIAKEKFNAAQEKIKYASDPTNLGKDYINSILDSESKAIENDFSPEAQEKRAQIAQARNDMKTKGGVHSKQMMDIMGVDKKGLTAEGLISGEKNFIDVDATGSVRQGEVMQGLSAEAKAAQEELRVAQQKSAISPKSTGIPEKSHLSGLHGDNMKGETYMKMHENAMSGAQEQLAKDFSAPKKTGVGTKMVNMVDAVLDSKVASVGGKILGGADVAMSGYNAVTEYNKGNNFFAATNAFEAVAVTAATVAPSPLTVGIAAGAAGFNAASGAIQHMATRDWRASSFSTAYTGPASMAGQDSVPMYARNAFTTPPMAHTSTAMADSGYNPATAKNAYGDTTNVANTGASSYKADTTESSQNTMEDMKMSAEFTEWNTEDLANTMKELSETIYSGDSSKGGQE